MSLFSNVDFSAVNRDEHILPHIRNDAWFQQAAAERTISELTELKERMDGFDDRRLQIIQGLASLLARQPRILSRPMSVDRSRELAKVRGEAYQLRRRLSDAYDSFLRDSYRRYLAPDTGCEVRDALVQEMRKNLIGRFESIVRPDVKKCLDTIDAFIRRCQAAEK